MTYLPLIEKVDTFPYPSTSLYNEYMAEVYSFKSHDDVLIGYIIPLIAKELSNYPEILIVDQKSREIKIQPSLDTFEKRNEKFAQLAAAVREKDLFDTLKGWRNELYTVHNPTSTPYFLVERAFSILLGVITYGVHIIGYIPPEVSSTGEIKFIIPRRSYNKPTFPGMLDNTVAGGLGFPYSVSETCIKECYEEAGLDEEYVKNNLKGAGVLTYMFQHESTIDSEEGLIQPETEFIYDLPLTEDVKLTAVDNEVHEFFSYSMEEINESLKKGEFKPNCAMVLVDFLVRHNYTTIDNEPNYLEIVSRSHRRFPFPSM